jgi:hypothetical protein
LINAAGEFPLTYRLRAPRWGDSALGGEETCNWFALRYTVRDAQTLLHSPSGGALPFPLVSTSAYDLMGWYWCDDVMTSVAWLPSPSQFAECYHVVVSLHRCLL